VAELSSTPRRISYKFPNEWVRLREDAVTTEDVELGAKALYDATGKQHGGYEKDVPRKGLQTYRQFEWEELSEEDKGGIRRHARAALVAVFCQEGKGVSDDAWKMVSRSDADYDLVAGGLVVELSRGEDGRWTFWAVRFEGAENRIGSIDSTMPPDVVRMLDVHRDALIAEMEADDAA
jgi:hypothetical protein